MSQDKDPGFYESLIASELTPEEVRSHLMDITSILGRMEKGLKILEKMGRKPEKKVLENKKRFLRIQARLNELAN